MSRTPPARSEAPVPVYVDRRIVGLAWLADLCLVAAILATVFQRSFLGLVLAILTIGLALSARKRARRQPRWAGSGRVLLALIGGLVVVLFSLPLLIGGLLALGHP